MLLLMVLLVVEVQQSILPLNRVVPKAPVRVDCDLQQMVLES